MELGVWMCVLHVAGAYSSRCACGSGGGDMVAGNGLECPMMAKLYIYPLLTFTYDEQYLYKYSGEEGDGEDAARDR
jgi:hypothetical protein